MSQNSPNDFYRTPLPPGVGTPPVATPDPNTPVAQLPTKDQPHLSSANILAHPGSTYAGAGLVFITLGQMLSTNAMPTTSTGWITLACQIALALLAAFGK